MLRVPGVAPKVKKPRYSLSTISNWSKPFSTKVTDKMVEFVDIMPTLVEAAGFPPVDKCPEYSRNVSWCRS